MTAASEIVQGFEFDDVFLLDFFADSPANAEWRVLLSYLEEVAPEHVSMVSKALGETLAA